MRQIPGVARRTLPLTTSAMHNTKQNEHVTSNLVADHGYFLRSFQGMAIRSLSMDPLQKTVSDKTVIDCKYSTPNKRNNIPLTRKLLNRLSVFQFFDYLYFFSK